MLSSSLSKQGSIIVYWYNIDKKENWVMDEWRNNGVLIDK